MIPVKPEVKVWGSGRWSLMTLQATVGEAVEGIWFSGPRVLRTSEKDGEEGGTSYSQVLLTAPSTNPSRLGRLLRGSCLALISTPHTPG